MTHCRMKNFLDLASECGRKIKGYSKVLNLSARQVGEMEIGKSEELIAVTEEQ